MVGSYTNIVFLPLYLTVTPPLPPSASAGQLIRRRIRARNWQGSIGRVEALPENAASPAENPKTLPFCSSRPRDVDLNRWLSGHYVIPGKENEGERDED